MNTCEVPCAGNLNYSVVTAVHKNERPALLFLRLDVSLNCLNVIVKLQNPFLSDTAGC